MKAKRKSKKEKGQIKKEKLAKVILKNDSASLHKLLKTQYPIDIAEALETLDDTAQLSFFKTVSIEKAADVLQELSHDSQTKIIETLSVTKASDIVEEMDTDDAADLLGELPEDKAQEIIKDMEPEEADDVTELLAFEEESAGGIMSKEFLAIPEKLTVKQALAKIRESEPPDNNAFSYVYVINSEQKLVGVVTIRDLVMAKPSIKVKKIRHDNVVSVSVDTDQEKVANIISKYDLVAIPVLDYRQRIIGIVTIDDVFDIVEEEVTEDIYRFTGTNTVDEEILLKGSLIKAIFSRLPWLFLTMFGGFLAGYVIKQFSPHISNLAIPITIIMSFVPLLIGMAGNIGTQSAAIIVRGIATGHIERHQTIKKILREAAIGLLIGICLGLVAVILSLLLHTDVRLGFIIGIALTINMMIATALGTLIPLGFRHFGVDPAVASGPMLTTSLDTIGLLVYFSITLSLINILF